MRYVKAADVLPKELLDKIQSYVDGGYLYVPRKEENRKPWGERTKSRELTRSRNREIYGCYRAGMSVTELSEAYYLSPKSIQRILASQKTGQ